MGSGIVTPPMDHSSPIDGGIRKRVCKACDRCRLKKSKCDGSSPCTRCKADNAICVFGERKKSHDKVYPKGYVEMLESQQSQLVAGLQELYRRLQTGEGWTGAPLKENGRGSPLTHDILERLGALKHDEQTPELFEENLEALQRKLAANGSSFMKREESLDTSSDIDHSPSFEQISMHKFPIFTNPFQQVQKFPPTPPEGSPLPHSAKASSPLRSRISPASFPQTQMNNSWQPDYSDYMEGMDYNMAFDAQFESPVDMMAFQTQMFNDPTVLGIAPALTMKDWQDERYFNANMLS